MDKIIHDGRNAAGDTRSSLTMHRLHDFAAKLLQQWMTHEIPEVAVGSTSCRRLPF